MRVFMAMALAAVLALSFSGGAATAGDNPIFGSAKVQKLDKKAMELVVGQNSTSAYYAYLGNFYAGTAIQYGSYGAYLESLGSGYQSARYNWYYNAYAYALTASYYYRLAYNTN